ncbi:MAG: porphobilinogen synthase [Alphaproteobacteria bacterium]|nr:porphobilinogen synthase [Alphaproteobacteria bacterium]
MSVTCHLPPAPFPLTRLRRLRQAPWIRELAAETRLHPSDLILPIFVTEGENRTDPVASMPGVARLSLDLLAARAKEAQSLGIPAIALFPHVEAGKKTPLGEEALNPDNLVCRAIKTLKNAVPEIGVIADVALDPYTSHGHDGIIENGDVANDATAEILCQQALLHAEAGCDIIAPSDMMDGRIGAIRTALEVSGYTGTMILSYAAKYASAMYGPFRDGVGSSSALGKADKRTYQMNPANADEAMREIAMDIAEGADMVMVKPGLPYLDVIRRAAGAFDVPVLAYQVSGEYAMIQAAAANGWVDGPAVMHEQLLALKRAGARAILTYAAVEVAKTI